MNLEETFLYAHCKAALSAEPSWTVRMYGVFNDLDEDDIKDLERLLPEFKTSRSAPDRAPEQKMETK
jgi:hypothetical protein